MTTSGQAQASNARRRERPFVLLVEDDDGDAYLVREAFAKAPCAIDLLRVANGEEALSFLRDGEAPTPDLILLDINMPRVTGHQVMEEIVNDAVLRRQPVVVLSTSSAPDDVRRMQSLRCNTYIVKPRDIDALQRVVNVLCDYWFSVALLPTHL